MAHDDHLVRLLAETKGKRGTADARRIVEQILRRKESWFCRLYGREDMDAIDTLIKASAERAMYEKHLRGNYEAAYQLLKGGIDTPEAYRQAREALLALGDPSAGQKTLADIIADAERQLVGLKIPGFFPTPEPVVKRLLELADIAAGDRVLEPSAGKGNIADGIRQACPEAQIEVCEYQHRLRTILELKGYTVIGSDFLNLKPDEGYDTIVMNPPFENFQDVEHVRHAYQCLKPGGRVVAVMGEGAFFRQDKIAATFRQWLADSGGYEERLPEGSFKASGTGVAARIVVLDKPAMQPSQQPTPEEKIEVFTQLSLF
jgi:phospholipid N-methyltransferase